MDRRLARALIVLLSTAAGLAIALPIYRAMRAVPVPPGKLDPKASTYRGPAFHILIVGGSVPYGTPYEERSDFGRILAWMYGGRMDGLPIVVKNLAGLGEDSNAELADARTLIAEEKDPKHAVLLYYTGNNEIVPFGREIDFGKRDRRLFDERLVEPAKWEEVLHKFEENVTTIVREARAAGIATILSTASENFAWQPDRSVLADPAHEALVRAEIDAGEALAARGEHEAALARWKAVLAVEPHFAWAEQRSGDALRALGRFEDARAAYQAAIDDNGAPTVATSRHNAILRAIAERERVPWIDSEAIVRAAAPDGLPGFELFWDNCHPTLDGYRIIARAFAPEITRLFGEAPEKPDPTVAEIEEGLGFDAEFLARIEARQGQYCYAASCLIWNPKERLARSRLYIEAATRVLPDDSELTCTRAVLALFEGDLEGSRALWRTALKQDPKWGARRLKSRYVKGLLEGLGVADGASWVK